MRGFSPLPPSKPGCGGAGLASVLTSRWRRPVAPVVAVGGVGERREGLAGGGRGTWHLRGRPPPPPPAEVPAPAGPRAPLGAVLGPGGLPGRVCALFRAGGVAEVTRCEVSPLPNGWGFWCFFVNGDGASGRGS